MSKLKVIFIVIIGLAIIWGGRVIMEYDDHSDKEETREYVRYIEDYQAEIKGKIDDFKSDMGTDLDILYDAQAMGPNIEKCISNNFEGAAVKVYGIQFYDKLYGQASERGYKWACNTATLDPDHQYYGLPSISVEVQDVNFFNPANSAFEKFNQWMGAKKEGPYRTYEKQILITDSTGNTSIKKFAMELWLTKFNVTVSINANRDKPGIAISDEELSNKIYPRYWYGSAEPGRVSINDLRNKEEYDNQLYGNIELVLELIPNASPWYIKTANAETAKPKIAIAGVFCQHYTVDESLEPTKIQFSTFAGKSSPLFFYPFEKNDQMLDSALSNNTNAFYERINEINTQDIWDRPYYIRFSSTNIGSRNKLTAIKGLDDRITFELLMPLFVVGDLEVTLPSELMAEWNPPDRWDKSFSLKNLLPDWGLSGIGKFFSGILIAGIVLLILITVTPLARIFGRFIS